MKKLYHIFLLYPYEGRTEWTNILFEDVEDAKRYVEAKNFTSSFSCQYRIYVEEYPVERITEELLSQGKRIKIYLDAVYNDYLERKKIYDGSKNIKYVLKEVGTMNDTEIMQWAIKGIDAEIDKKEKSLKRGLLLIQAHKKGVQESNLSLAELNNRVKKVRAEIENLGEKRAYLKVQLEDWD